ncbi:hypothetical protein OAT16_08515 [Prolixibacteraceae bacterium]|nr:hypothetical protein [Prolixibacteraceae bacterium]
MSQTTNNMEASPIESLWYIKQTMVDHLNYDELKEAQAAYEKLINHEDANSVMLYSEWIYCSTLFGDTEQFRKMSNVDQYSPQMITDKVMEKRYKASKKTIKRCYSRHYREIKKNITEKESIDKETSILYVFLFIITDPRAKPENRRQQKDLIVDHLQSNPYTTNKFYINWLLKELSGVNSVSTESNETLATLNHANRTFTTIGIGMNGYNPSVSFFNGGKGVYYSIGVLANEFYLDLNIGNTFCKSNIDDEVFGEDGRRFPINKNTDLHFTNISIGFGPKFNLGESYLALLGRLGYSRMKVTNDNKTYYLTQNINISPAAQLGLSIYKKKAAIEGHTSFKLFIVGEVGYNKSIIKMHKKIEDDGSYFQVGLNFAF